MDRSKLIVTITSFSFKCVNIKPQMRLPRVNPANTTDPIPPSSTFVNPKSFYMFSVAAGIVPWSAFISIVK